MREKEFLPLVESRLGITELNPMQKRMMGAASEKRDMILLSPTGSGKTLAFTLPMLKMLNPPSGKLQGVVITPSRELTVQVAGIIRSVAAGYKVTALYGGHKVEDEVNSLSVVPDLIVATPGRLLDHLKRGNIDPQTCRILVLDEFDKSLELGFEEDMRKIIGRLKNVSRIILTSATRAEILPDFLKLNDPLELDYLEGNSGLRRRMTVFRVDSDGKDKLQTLLVLLDNLMQGGVCEKTIIFANYRESAERIYEFLKKRKAAAVLYHGALDQRERETALTMFNNGSAPLLVATDLAARGLDIDKVRNIIHYHQPLTPETYAHRNGRTARVEESGEVFVLVGPGEDMKEYVVTDRTMHLDTSARGTLTSGLASVCIGAGKKEKLSKGDIVGFLTKECGVECSMIGNIALFDHYAIVAVSDDAIRGNDLIFGNMKIKGEKRRITNLNDRFV